MPYLNLLFKIFIEKFLDNFFKNIFPPLDDLFLSLLISKDFLLKLKKLDIIFKKKKLFLEKKQLKHLKLIWKFQEFSEIEKSETNSPFLAKFVDVEGTIVQMKELKHIIFALLVECIDCESIFYCFFDSFLDYKPFMCVKANCRSQNFLSHKNKLCSVIWRKIRIQKENRTLKKKTKTGFIDIELVGKKIIDLRIGNRIQVKGVLKIQKFISNFKMFSFFRNIFVFYILGQTMVKAHRIRTSYLKNFLTKREYLFFSKFKKMKNLFARLVKSMNFLGKKNDGFKAFLLFSLSLDKNELKNRPCFVNVLLDEKYPKNNNLFSKIAFFLTNGIFLKETNHLSTEPFFPKNFGEIHGNNFLENFENHSMFIQSLFQKRDCCFDTWRENIDLFLNFNFKKKNLPNFVFFEFRLEKKTIHSTRFLFNSRYKNAIRDFDFTISIREFGSKINSRIDQEGSKKNKTRLFKTENKENNFSPFWKKSSLLNRKFSKYMLKRFLFYLKNFKSPILSETTNNFLIRFYLFLKKNFKKDFISNKIFFLENSILFSKIKAKLNFCVKVSVNDILETIEILSYPKKIFKRILKKFLFSKGTKLSKKVFEIISFLKILKKLNLNGKRNIFNFQEIIEKIECKNQFFNTKESINFLEEYGLVEKFGKKFFRITDF